MMNKLRLFVASFLLFSFFGASSWAIDFKALGTVRLEHKNKVQNYSIAVALYNHKNHIEILDDFGNSLLISQGEIDTKILKRLGFKIKTDEFYKLLKSEIPSPAYQFIDTEKSIIKKKNSSWNVTYKYESVNRDKPLAKNNQSDKNPTVPNLVIFKSQKATLTFSWNQIDTL